MAEAEQGTKNLFFDRGNLGRKYKENSISMELVDFLKLIYRRKIIVLIFIGIGIAAGLIYALVKPTNYRASLLIYVQRETQPASDQYFNYDGYYALQTSTEYTNTVLGLIKSLDVLQRGAEITPYISRDNQKLEQLSAQIKVVKKAPQLIEIAIDDSDQNMGKAVVLALAQSSQERVRILNQNGDKALTIGLVNDEPLVLVQKASLPFCAILGFGFSLILSLILVLIIGGSPPRPKTYRETDSKLSA